MTTKFGIHFVTDTIVLLKKKLRKTNQ